MQISNPTYYFVVQVCVCVCIDNGLDLHTRGIRFEFIPNIGYVALEQWSCHKQALFRDPGWFIVHKSAYRSTQSLRYGQWSVSRDSSVGIATVTGLDDPRIESRWRRGFPHPSTPALGPTHPTVQWVPGLSRGQSGRGLGSPPTPSNAVVKERV